MLLKLLHPAAVKTPVLLADVHDEEVVYLAVFHHRQFHFGLAEALGVVPVKLGSLHVHPRHQQLVSSRLRLEHPAHHRQTRRAAPLAHLTGQGDVFPLSHHRERRGSDRDVDGRAHIWNGCDIQDLIQPQYSRKMD